jgi:hypothetical protein
MRCVIVSQFLNRPRRRVSVGFDPWHLDITTVVVPIASIEIHPFPIIRSG